ncbi:MAG: hypothetical protein JW395_4161 [Nitrospira sp.]|nr:hypothetical protein [Nitrospira sp.]
MQREITTIDFRANCGRHAMIAKATLQREAKWRIDTVTRTYRSVRPAASNQRSIC